MVGLVVVPLVFLLVMVDMLLLVVVVFSRGEDVDEEEGDEMDFFLGWLGEMCRTWPQVLRQDLQRP